MRVPDQRHLWLGNGHRGRCALTRTVNASHARRAFLQPTRAHVHAIAHLKLSAMAGCLSVKTAGHEVRANQAASVRRHFLRVGDERRWIRCPEIELRGRIASAVRAFLCNDGMRDSHGDMPARASAVVQVLSPTAEALTCLPHAHHACARSFHVAALLTRRKWADPPTAERVG